MDLRPCPENVNILTKSHSMARPMGMAHGQGPWAQPMGQKSVKTEFKKTKTIGESSWSPLDCADGSVSSRRYGRVPEMPKTDPRGPKTDHNLPKSLKIDPKPGGRPRAPRDFLRIS